MLAGGRGRRPIGVLWLFDYNFAASNEPPRWAHALDGPELR